MFGTTLASTFSFALLGLCVGVLDMLGVWRRRDGQVDFDRAHTVPSLFWILPPLLLLGLAFLFLMASRESFQWTAPFYFVLYLPVAVWSGLGLLFGFTAGFLLCAAFLTDRKDRWQLALVVVLVGVLGASLQWRNHRDATFLEIEPIETRSGYVMQSTGVTCAAASGANISRHFGLKRGELDVALAMGTTASGTSVPQIIVGMESLGFDCERFKVDAENLAAADIPAPAMLMVDHPATGPNSHAVALLACENGTFAVFDPLQGHLQRMTPEELGEIWRGRGIAVRPSAKQQAPVVTPPSAR